MLPLPCLSLSLLAAVVLGTGIIDGGGGLEINGLNCPSSDNGGSKLDNTIVDSTVNGVHFDVLCTYFSGAQCAYLDDGSADNADSTDENNVCPSNLDGATSNSHSTSSRPSTTFTSPTPTPPPPTSPPPTLPTSSPTTPTRPFSSAPSLSQISPAKPDSVSLSHGTAPASSTRPSSAIGGTRNSSSELPSSSATGVSTVKADRNGARTAAIAGTVVFVCFLVGVLLLILWVRRRRRRADRAILPEPYVDQEEQRSLSDTLGRRNLGLAIEKSAGTPVPGTSPRPDAIPVEPESAVKSGDTTCAGTSPQSDSMPVEPESAVVSDISAAEGIHRDETLALRVRVQRMEAQLEALLTLGEPEGAPPSYRG
ncbi:hypothetical protein DFH09DRAFT_1215057 [Mycena vulgaris]|nr:hypothetical protein DFH09DRAFT_1215057 [Mycena vulgaris]